MTVRHHPSDETLARFSSGGLGAGGAIVVAAHLEGCAQCRRAVATFEAVGGALLDALPGDVAAPPREGLSHALARIDRPAEAAPRARKGRPPNLPAGATLPRALDGCDFGAWKWLAPGIYMSRAEGDWARAADLQLLRVGAGKRLPRHGHTGVEWTQMLTGAYADGDARYAEGDFSEVDEHINHQPVVEADAGCVCLVAAEGRTVPNSWIGRLYQAIFDR